MYLINRTIEIAPDVNPAEAIQAANTIAAYLSRKHGVDAKVAVNVSGYQHELHWIVITDSIDSMADYAAERAADEEWQTLLAPYLEAALFSPNTTRDEILRITN